MKNPTLYILECSDGTYYTGCTSMPGLRAGQHCTGLGSTYTSLRLPVKLIYVQEFGTMEEAIAAEKQVKHWSRAKKQALIRNDFGLIHYLAECKNNTSHKNKINK